MPIVLSYNDVQMLGTLAQQAGRGAGMAQRAQQNAQILQTNLQGQYQLAASTSAQHAATARQQSQQAFQAQQMAQDRDLRRELLGEQQGFQGQQTEAQLAARAAENQTRVQAALEESRIREDARFQREMMGAVTQAARDERQHLQRRELLEREIEAGRFAGSAGRNAPQLTPGGAPNRQQAQDDALAAGHLIPFKTTGTPRGMGMDQEQKQQQAMQLASLPTATLEGWVANRPGDPWAPYVNAVLEARRQATAQPAAQDGTPTPQGGRLPGGQTVGMGGQAAGGQGMTGTGFGGTRDPRFANLSDEQLMALAAQMVGSVQGPGVQQPLQRR